jgi:serine protease Do
MLPTPALVYAGSKPKPEAVSLADVAERVLPSVVNISTTKVVKRPGGRHLLPFFSDPFFRHFFGKRLRPFEGPREHKEKSLGSGVIVSADGVILTNNHVVARATEIRVTTADKQEFEAKVVGTDPKSDLAVVRLEDKVTGLEPLAFGDSSKLRLGDFVLAIGNPFGVGQTVTMGIVSAKGRANVGIVDYEDFIQTDAAINPGNSGGALVNLHGQLVGINTAILSRTGGYQGIGFAIPSNMAKPIMQSLLEHGKVVRGFLGVSIQDLSPALARAMGLPKLQGVLVSDVHPKSPAAKAGFKRGDIILRVGTQPVRTSARLRNLIAAKGPGAEVSIEIVRNRKHKTLKVTLGTLPEAAKIAAKLDPSEGALGGIQVTALTDEARRTFKIPARIRHGVVVKSIRTGTPAHLSGLRPGDVIMQVNRHGVKSVAGFMKHYKQASKTVVLLVYRHGGTFYLMLRK